MIMSEERQAERLKKSIDLVEKIIEEVFVNYSLKEAYGLKDRDPSYEVWMEHPNRVIHTFTKGQVESCTDPDRWHATQAQEYVMICVRQKLEALLNN